MYPCSQAYHNAVASNAHQMALLIFSDAVFTNADIDVSGGIEFNDYFNTEEDLSIGQVPSNEISFALFNDAGLLNSYVFGEFTALIGVQIGNETVTENGTIQAQSENHTYTAHGTSPYLKRDGTAVATQPAGKVASILIYNGTVYCRLENGTVVGYTDSTGASAAVSVSSFMTAQMAKWSGEGISYSDRILRIWRGKNLRTYEFVPLGKFVADRPKVPDVILIDMHCMDFMQKFENDMPTPAQLGMSYPATVKTLLQKMCAYVGVALGTDSFINDSAVMSAEPEEFRSATMREVLKWIAEAGAGNARFNRDGLLVIDWVRDSGLVLTPNDYETFDPHWYETRKVTKLYNRASNGSYDNSVGSGDEGYLIQDNPILKGVS